MNNKKLMKKVIELDTQKLHTREQSLRVYVQISIIRKAFGVKNTETNEKVLEFSRERVLSEQEIRNEFIKYIGFWEWAIKTTENGKEREFQNQIFDFIEGVRFFDKELAEKFDVEYVSHKSNIQKGNAAM